MIDHMRVQLALDEAKKEQRPEAIIVRFLQALPPSRCEGLYGRGGWGALWRVSLAVESSGPFILGRLAQARMRVLFSDAGLDQEEGMAEVVVLLDMLKRRGIAPPWTLEDGFRFAYLEHWTGRRAMVKKDPDDPTFCLAQFDHEGGPDFPSHGWVRHPRSSFTEVM